MTTPDNHNPRLKLKRINFADTGDFWEIRSILNVALDREFADIALQTQTSLHGEVVDPEFISSLAKRVDHFLLKCTTSWSYGDITMEVLHTEVPAHHYQKVGDEAVLAYTPLVLKRIETLLSAYSSLSKPEEQAVTPDSPSHLNSSSPT